MNGVYAIADGEEEAAGAAAKRVKEEADAALRRAADARMEARLFPAHHRAGAAMHGERVVFAG